MTNALNVLLPELKAYAGSLCGDPAEAEDLVQDAIERSLRASSAPAEMSQLRPWMFRVIRNLHYDELRKRRVRREYFASEKRLSNGPVGVDVARDTLVRMAFERLPPAMREIVFLVDVMGLSYAEAATVIDVPHGTVMSRVSRARRTLLAKIEDPAETPRARTQKT